MTTYNTGNPIGSTDPKDLYDNAENLDEAVNSSADTFQDRMGRSRLTWNGIVKAGTGDAGVIVPIVQQAVQDVVDGVDGQVSVAKNAANRAEAARDAAIINSQMFPNVATGRAAVADGEYFKVIGDGDVAAREYRRTNASTSELVAEYPSKSLITDNGFVRIFGASAGNINFTTSDRMLVFSGTVFAYTQSGLRVIPNQSVNLPPAISYRLELDVNTNLITARPPGASRTYGNLVIGNVRSSGNGITTQDFEYAVDGVVGNTPNEEPVATDGILLSADISTINFDFVANLMTIEGNSVRFLHNNSTRLLTKSYSIELPSTGSRWYSIVYNVIDDDFYFRESVLPNSSGDVVVGRFNAAARAIVGIPRYTVQGKVVENFKTSIITADFLIPYGNLNPDYEQPDLPDYYDIWQANSGDYTKFYDLYDALVSSHPEYITKTNLGSDALGNPIFQYQFTTPEVPTTSSTSKKPKVIIISGIHGGEKAGMYNVYLAMKEIAERWAEDSHLEALKWGVNFIVLPCVNPSGYNSNSRFNHNGVDLARNFPARWSSNLDNPGTAPLSEPETVIMDSVMANNTDAVYLCSHHNFGDNTSNFLWNASPSYFSRSLAKQLIVGQTIRAKKRYSWMPQSNDYYIGYSDLGAPYASESMQAMEAYGMNGSTFEISSSFAWETGMPTHSSAVYTIGVEAFINWLLLNIKYGIDLYNTKINI